MTGFSAFPVIEDVRRNDADHRQQQQRNLEMMPYLLGYQATESQNENQQRQ